jgi:hypothetical protein
MLIFLVHELQREETSKSVKVEIVTFKANYCRKQSLKKRKPLNQAPVVLSSSTEKRKYLLQETAKYFLGTNEPANHSENPYFHQFVFNIANMGGLTADDLDVLKVKAVDGQMLNHAELSQKTSLVQWESSCLKYGGALVVDGWTARMATGCTGILFTSLLTNHFSLSKNGRERSTAEDYMEKMKYLPWHRFDVFVSDGAANMVRLGELVEQKHYTAHILCAAHGFSLMAHYTARAFENRSSLFGRLSGVISFFNYSPRRMEILKTYSNGLQPTRLCKTRFAYQVLAVQKLIKLRTPAKKALLDLTEEVDGVDADPESITSAVNKTLQDDSLFSHAEAFYAITLPILLAMRMCDRGYPIAGFIYYIHAQVELVVDRVFDHIANVGQEFEDIRLEVMSDLRLIWEKRHSPILSFAYLCNPVFHSALTSDGANPLLGDPSFETDVKSCLMTMIMKQESHLDELGVLQKFCSIKIEMMQYFNPFDPEQKIMSRQVLAADWWRMNMARYPQLSRYASRALSMPVVSSRLERFFSTMADVQCTKRSRLDVEKASLFAGAYLSMNSREETDHKVIQSAILKFVDGFTVESVKDSPNLDDIERWVENLATHSSELIYAPASTSTSVIMEESILLREIEEHRNVEPRIRASRVRTPPNILNL